MRRSWLNGPINEPSAEKPRMVPYPLPLAPSALVTRTEFRGLRIGLRRFGRTTSAVQGTRKLVARGEVHFGEDLAQVILDGARTDEQAGADLGVGQPLAGQPGDLGLLGGQLTEGRGAALANRLPGGTEFAGCARCKGLHPHFDKHVVS